MTSTRLSLLTQASSGSDQAWSTMVEVYRPLVYGWLCRHGVSHHDAEELTQEVLSVVVRELPAFSHSGNTGAFRSWLRQITVHRAKGFWRAGKLRPTPTGKSSFLQMVEQLADETSDLSRHWDREHDLHVLRLLLQKMESQFGPTTLNAFRRLVFDVEPAEKVAQELGLTLAATYSAKSRVLRKLRQEAAGLVEESFFS